MPIAKNQKLMYGVIENMGSMVRVVDEESNIIYMNVAMREEFGDYIGQKCFTMVCQENNCEDCVGKKCLKTKKVESKTVELEGKSYQIIASPAKFGKMGEYSIEIFYDITEQQKIENDMQKHYKMLRDAADFLKQVQRLTLPENKNYANSLKVSAAYVPSDDQGGDFYDVIKIDEDRLLFYIADVSGHGLQASMLTLFLRTQIRGMKERAADLTWLMDEVIKSYHELKVPKDMFISLLCGVYNIKTRGLSLINAGHNCLPLVVECGKNDCKMIEIQVSGLPVCALTSEVNHEIVTAQMEKGDRIIVYTDGLTEAYNSKTKKQFGIAGMMDVVGPNTKRDGSFIASNLILAAKRFSDEEIMDDMAIMVLDIL